MDGGRTLFSRHLGAWAEASPLITQSLSHRSWCAESDDAPSNERLEFLGDAVLSLAVAEHCYLRFPDMSEGELAKVRAAVVNARVLAELATELDLGQAVLLGKGEEASGGRQKASILADTFEAVIGAIYLERGWAEARDLVLGQLGGRIDDVAREPDGFDPKGRLQEWAARQGGAMPHYVVSGSGPDHDRRFEATVYVDKVQCGTGVGSTKKNAEQHAALEALSRLGDA